MHEINNIGDLTDLEFIEEPIGFAFNEGSTFDVSNKIINIPLIIPNIDFTSIKFDSCIFNEPVIIRKITVYANFEFTNCTFEKDFILENLTIKGAARFWSSKFNSSFKLNNVRFEKLADFYNTYFTNTFILYKVDLIGTAVFTEAKFKNSVLFTYTKICDFLIFTRTIFDKGVDLSLALISGNIIYFESKINTYPDYKINAHFDQDKYLSAVEVNGKIPIVNKLETYRILKKHSKNSNNQFLAIGFAKEETETYSKLLKLTHKNIDSKGIFLLNRISNNHSTSWTLGILFTLTAGLLFFYLAMISSSDYTIAFSILNWKDLLDMTSKYLIFLLPTHKFDDLYHLTNPLVLLFDILGRIFIGYGIYQTIQAFRKYT